MMLQYIYLFARGTFPYRSICLLQIYKYGLGYINPIYINYLHCIYTLHLYNNNMLLEFITDITNTKIIYIYNINLAL